MKNLETRDDVSVENQPLFRMRNPHGIEDAVVELLSDGITIVVNVSNNRIFSWERSRTEPPLVAYSKFVTKGEFFENLFLLDPLISGKTFLPHYFRRNGYDAKCALRYR